MVAQEEANLLDVDKMLVPTQMRVPANSDAPYESDPIRFPND